MTGKSPTAAGGMSTAMRSAGERASVDVDWAFLAKGEFGDTNASVWSARKRAETAASENFMLLMQYLQWLRGGRGGVE